MKCHGAVYGKDFHTTRRGRPPKQYSEDDSSKSMSLAELVPIVHHSPENFELLEGHETLLKYLSKDEDVRVVVVGHYITALKWMMKEAAEKEEKEGVSLPPLPDQPELLEGKDIDNCFFSAHSKPFKNCFVLSHDGFPDKTEKVKDIAEESFPRLNEKEIWGMTGKELDDFQKSFTDILIAFRLV